MKIRAWVSLSWLAVILSPPPPLRAQEIPVVADLSELEAFIDESWTNNPTAKLFPPRTTFEVHLGGVAYDSPPLTNLVAITNENVVLYPVQVVETNLPTRRRIYLNAEGTPVHTNSLAIPNSPNPWIEETYGDPPVYLAGDDLDAWYAERDPARCTIELDLLDVTNATAYLELLTNAVSTQTSTQSWEELLGLYSNDIAAVGIFGNGGGADLYIHAPTNIVLLDVFRTADLTDTNGWTHRAILTHTADPSHLFDEASSPQFSYAGADALGDPDGDLLASGREFFLYGTSAWTNDTDGDGLTDGQEILTYGLNALKADSDGDGLSDYDELQLGANPWLMDTDLDWASDGYEVDQGTSPINAADVPALWIAIDDGAFYATSTVLSLTFPGLVADRVAVSEFDDLGGALVHDFGLPVPLVLNTTSQGLHAVYAQAFRGEWPLEEAGPYLSGSVVLDTESPLLSVTKPLELATLPVPGVDIRGTVSDASDSVRVWVNNQRVDGVEQGEFRFLGFPLEPGTNELTVVAVDLVGNATQVVVTVDHDWSDDTNAPSFALGLDPETRVGNMDFLEVVGTTDDDYATVQYTVTTDDGQTNGPYTARTQQGQLLTQVPLQPGTNVIDIIATDAAGNQSTARHTVIHDPDIDFRFTSPEDYSVQNGGTITVSGVAPASFMHATVTVNDVEVELSPRAPNSFSVPR